MANFEAFCWYFLSSTNIKMSERTGGMYVPIVVNCVQDEEALQTRMELSTGGSKEDIYLQYSSALLDLKEKKGSETEKSENLGLVVFPFLEMLAELKKKPPQLSGYLQFRDFFRALLE